MIHIAIMKKSWGLTGKILKGEKTIETRWYKNKSKPWDCVKAGDVVYFKDSGDPVSVKATVAEVEQFSDLNDEKRKEILAKYSSKDLGTTEITNEIAEYIEGKKYAIIIYLKNPEKIVPFEIDKTGFGLQSAWLCIDDIDKIKICNK